MTDFCSNVLLTFPLLTKFESKICAWFVHASSVYVNTPQLQTISIEHDIDMPYYYKNPPTSRINFYCSALNLKEFSYCSFLPQEVSVPSPCHTSAKIIVHESQSYVSYMTDFKVFELLSQFSHAKSIKFELTKVSISFSLLNN